MADISDVRQALAQFIGGLLYPGGIPAGPTPASPIVGVPVRIYPGAPEREALDNDLAAGIVNVTVEVGQDGQDTTRFPVVDQVIGMNPATLGWAIAGTTATLGGTVSTPQNAGLLVDGKAYLYAVQPVDTLATIAAAVAALIGVDQPATAVGAVVSVPQSRLITGRIGTVGQTLREVARELLTVGITVWAPSQPLRRAVAVAFEPNLRDLRRFALPDQSIAQIWLARSYDDDQPEKAMLYKRNAFYSVEYATTIAGTAPQILTFVETVTPVSVLGGSTLAPTITTIS
jgi:hypothetical protein